MAAVVHIPIALPAAPSAFKAESSRSISQPTERTLLAAGPAFAGFARRAAFGRSFEEDDKVEAERLALRTADGEDVNDLDNDIGDEPEDRFLLSRDPKEWKSQDHYAVLGLSKLRYKATRDQVKIAHRKKVLKHHPDKKAGSGDANDDSFFKCIAKAFEVLYDPEKRRQFDSVDDGVDDDEVPTGKEPASKFFELWGPVFEREARFSKVQPVPKLGDMSSTEQHMNDFYDFWYNFDSWRSFEYLDKDANEGSDSRDEKRYVEKKNKSERARRKKEDNTRLRLLVDKALSLDPRVKKFKEEAKAAREAKRKAKAGGNGAVANGQPGVNSAEEKKRKEEEDKKAKEEAEKKEAEEKVQRADAKKAKEAAKKALKSHKKAIRNVVTGSNYFAGADAAVPPSVIEAQLNALDAICAKLEPEDVAALRKAVEEGQKNGGDEGAKKALAEAESKAGAGSAFA